MFWACVCLSTQPALAQICAGDCDSNGQITVDEIITATRIGLGLTPLSECASVDVNGDGQVTVNEVVKVVNNMFFRCGTLQPPPNLQIRVRNDAGVAAGAVRLTGRCVQNADTGSDSPDPKYEITTLGDSRCSSCGAGCTLCNLAGVEPGVWQHDVEVTATPYGNAHQKQFTTNVIVRDTSNPALIEWTIFKSVYEVNVAGDAGNGDCDDGSCTLRDAVIEANNTTQTPVLIQFDRQAFTTSVATIRLTNNAQLRFEKAGTVLDGTAVIRSGALLDARAQPSPVDPFSERRYPTSIVINPTDKSGSGANSGSFYVFAEKVQLIGLQIERVLGSDADVMNKDQDLVVFGGQSTPTVVRSRGSRIKNCLLDGGARSRPTAESNDFSGKDGVDTGQATGTTSFAEDQAIVIDNTQIRHNYDRGVKSQNAYVLVRDSWIHNNLRGGAFALQPRGRIKTEHTVLEANGKNASGASTHLAADQMSAQAASAASDGRTSRAMAAS
jgi:hypothetical protein